MTVKLCRDHNWVPNTPVVEITGSKSESNRLLILQSIYPEIRINNLSNSDDTRILQSALSEENKEEIDINHAGTAMRFLTALLASQPGKKVVLTGSERMKERPIAILVDALRELGANIFYIEKEGYPPLSIKGAGLRSGIIKIAAGTSSQYISALMLIAPSLPQGLELQLQGEVTSLPYIQMTAALLRQIGCRVVFSENRIIIPHLSSSESIELTVESDWSSASYYYSLVALSEDLSVKLKSYREESLQGDSALITIYEKLGVRTSFHPSDQSMILSKTGVIPSDKIELDLNKTPDIAQTIAVTCFGLGLECELRGLHTLKIKETDRLQALKTELEKLGASIRITDDSLHLLASEKINSEVNVKTYHDHRMAMAFAPLALKTTLFVEDSGVVSKSYPGFWDDLSLVGIRSDFEI
ncbi:3-phosphoshikimate 1-carboxyvinyltransferase [Aureitalea sp. L0-47]|uniref:3-phosphoshikimate 1-carboxyvinyltransferase n=1 Tax=Aureitalea sp. L0-47 TaxID=2816962 RepID=UPI00223747B3|nr:3-phosphoshikimate 1-carboxyvinyltransferase [Aureitalea sp. L0-47]MCW5520045.1 3-phosphoshikimate 1-carboxyvinyltransferase [Aureitalea sp. L0-47]